ncbi:precorrin-6Y C5,15-methyltransferase (decarboxylating) subunit CbiT [Pelotomaculum terephthalicicum JT]|uniref:precorrin-6Y C5,15-methyltransferase (decarboxylating) subunit CbiT n=1 Tax=Pelotomaculum TaxID=191373 RepID=UPI0009C4A53C|nr:MULTISPECIES: precorrin-6Y C5,15-methyltransferase (decarboxylating) subunit CbiT [Pelotomaculum]MCG9967329.1 precorrin-6Y C5,15-methyltransferase (decarboxylating) subunit CbiT [Pelotomaculum terephthalicicum JT]OPX90681.1 MAG: putative cobalt-precorrin-6Y C(15)-methyltransferase (decarboxylating) [Pelotomaculum sp. PtaB.Bin117]OPY61305.1 MAG: putative cobalt-precorrin-6Y C(15)-methyltransferase (decarboxylating) [Pelotomaculum sp. PtaU1.Bin065]
MTEVKWPYLTPGIPDAMFRREEGIPLTKEEIRILTMAKARLKPGQTVYDIGSGTGSLTVEAARLVSPGQVYAIEKEPAAAALTKANAHRFALNNVELAAGAAPAVLAGLPEADRVLVGGSCGRLTAILEECLHKLKPEGRIVINAITWETLLGGMDFARAHGLEPEVISINVARLTAAGHSQLWKSLNAIYIITLQV